MTWPTPATQNPTVIEVPQSSPEADELIAAGAKPVDVDPQELMRQMRAQMDEQQKYIDKLAAERGVALNPQDVYVLALTDHLAAQANANPRDDEGYKRVRALVSDMTENPKDVTVDRVAYLRDEIDDLRALHPQHELAYVASLAKSLHNHLRYPEASE